MLCPRCGRDNEKGNDFCGRCGLEFAQYSASVPVAPSEQQFCYRHKKEPTNLSCGRCGKFLCYKCAIIGPAGPRCAECAKNKVPVSARAVAWDVKRGISGVFSRLGRGGMYPLYFGLIMISMIFGLVRGCMPQREPRVPVHSRYDDDDYGPAPTSKP